MAFIAIQKSKRFPERSFSGIGNNIQNPLWGSVDSPLLKQAPDKDHGDLKSSEPNPRALSNRFCKQNKNQPNANGLTDMVWAWGQFLDHELDLTPDQEASTGFTFSVPDDKHEEFSGRMIEFTPSQRISVKHDGCECDALPNKLSAFIDASNVYGPTCDRARLLRCMDGSGKMKTQVHNGEVLLPFNVFGLDNANHRMVPEEDLFVAGDIRCNENVLLTAMHTLFVREHNRICGEIQSKNPQLQDLLPEARDEILFQYARRFIIGIMQNITFNEFLPCLVGEGTISPYKGYKDSVDPGIRREFSTVAFRIGHTMVSSQLQIGAKPKDVIPLEQAFFNPNFFLQRKEMDKDERHYVDEMLLGASESLMQEIDARVVNDLRNQLFDRATKERLRDLASLNIMRGRDHGISGYNAVRQAFGLMPATFEIFSKEHVKELKELYNSIDDVDPWLGGLLEEPVSPAIIGPLFTRILCFQFQRIRDGDRFWFEEDPGLSENDISYIKNRTLSQVILENCTTIENLRPDVFKRGKSSL